MRLLGSQHDEVNPYIAFTDIMINFLLVMIFFVAVMTLPAQIRAARDLLQGNDSEGARYVEVQSEVRQQVEQSLPDLFLHNHPFQTDANGYPISLTRYRNDPPGAQRWLVYGSQLFEPNSTQLTAEGKQRLRGFARVLREHHRQAQQQYPHPEWTKYTWRRIRIEGHNRPTRRGEKENWALAAGRAAAVAQYLQECGIPPWHVSISSRGGQTRLDSTLPPEDPRHERVEIVLEYAAFRRTGE